MSLWGQGVERYSLKAMFHHVCHLIGFRITIEIITSGIVCEKFYTLSQLA